MVEQPVAHNLPRLTTSFVGRKREIAEIRVYKDDPDYHLLTLTGPGGIGKTRLALEIASQMRDCFKDGVYFVPLLALQEVENIVTAIVGVLPLQVMDHNAPRQRLLDYLQDKRLLLVLDNFEHVLDSVGILTDILKASEHVKLLVTSRERLNLRAEQVWPLQGLELPEEIPNSRDLPSAVELFVERARRTQPDFLPQEHLNAVADICRTVDGMPLALELAATWVHIMPCEAIADEIKHNFDMLVSRQRDWPDRHQSIRAVFDHSWNLLTDAERTAFPRLSVFRGGFTAEAARAVAGATLHTLASLIDKSLLRLEDDDRYDLHELLRQYAEAQLATVGETEVTIHKHCDYFLRFMSIREPDLKGQRQIEALDQIDANFENVRAAWQHAVQADDHIRVDAAAESLFVYCTLRTRFQDHLTLFEQALTIFTPHGSDEARASWGRLLVRSFPFLTTFFTTPQPETMLKVKFAQKIAESHGDEREMAVSIHLLARLTLPESQAQALVLMEECLRSYAAIGEIFFRAYLLQTMVGSYGNAGQFEKEYTLLRESLEFCRIHNLRSSIGRSLSMLGMIEAFRHGNYLDGEGYVREAVNLFRLLKSSGETARVMRWLSCIVFVQGDFVEARELAEECRAIAHELHYLEYLSASSAILGMACNMQEDYRQGEVYGREALLHGLGIGVILADWSLACAYCGLGEFQRASDHLRSALHSPHLIVFQTGITTICAPIAACIHAHRGNAERSVELLGLAFTHPKSPTGCIERWPLMTRLRANLEAELSREVYATAWERGMSLDLEQLSSQLLREFTSELDDVTTQANKLLLDPLSQRELEVLALIADGYTNREIAERLFIGVSTVK